MIDRETLKALISQNHTRFWCDEEEQRIPFLEALEDMGFEWHSGNELTALNSRDYLIREGLEYSLNLSRRSILKGRFRSRDAIDVSDLFNSGTNIDEEDLLDLLGA